MQKIVFRISFFIFASLSYGGSVFAADPVPAVEPSDLTKSYRDALLEKLFEGGDSPINKLCGSSIDYSLSRDFKEVKKDFEDTVNCLFNDAFSQSTYLVTDTVKKEVGNAWDAEGLKKAGDFTSCKKDEVKKHLDKLKSLKTSCGDAGQYKTVIGDYSACRIGEQAWREYCGYEKFLWAKLHHDESISTWAKNLTDEEKKQYGLETSNEGSLSGYLKNVRVYEEPIEKEIAKSKQAVLDTIFLYQKYEQNYRYHTWLVTIWEGLKKTNELLTNLRLTVETYPFKFPDAATSP